MTLPELFDLARAISSFGYVQPARKPRSLVAALGVPSAPRRLAR
jgi:hypothetical protein